MSESVMGRTGDTLQKQEVPRLRVSYYSDVLVSFTRDYVKILSIWDRLPQFQPPVHFSKTFRLIDSYVNPL